MASKTTYIPRYLLPQYGALWRTTTRSGAFARPLNAELGQVLVRYASKTAASKPTTTAKTAKTTAAKVATPKAASTKASPTSTAARAAKHSAPTKPPAKATSTAKPAVIKPTPVSAAPTTPKAPTPKTPTSPAASSPAPSTSPAPAPKAKTPDPTPAAKPSAAPEPVDPSKPRVLEKPERFNPPSHGARLPRSTPRHYGGPMTDAEIQAQNTKAYPGLPPPPNTWSHWFLHNRWIHTFITLGTLTSLAIYTFATNFAAKSPFADMIPPISEFPRHPFQYIDILIEVMKLHERHESAITAEKRRRRVEDVAKRDEYRKAHGLEPATGLFGMGTKRDDDEGSKSNGGVEKEAAAAVVAAEPVATSEPEATTPTATETTPDGKRKKYLGIF
ncbi:uncharacterized protein F4822DRAFT_429486 [Hypoxylon trugodes]|uniref:uncharacterized protein n=1 Tax=Hypoxylon trugodes TaxID=326681 RepID=UPI00219E40AA|nr:uncharacterized protein F4822DRAFT_429486 [Hypoxylon trugodes]KAI1388869.1 hypothetical protein F4822DRAFT_429486 [Hypoxylon trugodes]